MSLKILVTDEELLSHVLNVDYNRHLIVSKTNTPSVKYVLDRDVQITVKTSLTDKFLRGRTLDIIYCTPQFYEDNKIAILSFMMVNSEIRPRVIIL